MSQSSDPQQPDPVRLGIISGIISGVIAIALIASVVGLAANSIRDHGSINFSRNYFKKLPVVTDTTEQAQPTTDSETGEAPAPDDGIQRLSFEEAHDNFITGEEEYESTGESIYLFVDARVRDQYEEGHIPGAVWLYHYESENLIDELRPELELAFFIIIYCNGGDCEDSIHLATDLMSLYGLPGENIFVYEGGLDEWVENEMPIVSGSDRR